MAADPTPTPDPGPIAAPVSEERAVIDAAREQVQIENAAAVSKLVLATKWVTLHPGDEVDTSIEWGMRELQIAGDGAPTIDEGAVAEFALAIGVSTDAGRLYLGDAVELQHRLPRIWHRVLDGRVPVWKARKVAQATRSLPMAGADAVDKAVYFVLHKCSFAEIDRQVERARRNHDPEEAERRRVAAFERRHVKTYWNEMTHDGVVPVTAMLDMADAVGFEEYVAAEAAKLDESIPLQVRRSMVLGRLGRHGHHISDDGGGVAETAGDRQLVIHVHLRPGQPMVEVDNTRTAITPEHLREWCQQAGTQVTIKPVIDLNEEITTDAYTPTPRQREQARLRYPECPFPYCHRPSWRAGQKADTDHIIEWPKGATTSSNLAPPCRQHHRLKTFTDWTYQRVPGVGWVWTSPLGHRHIG